MRNGGRKNLEGSAHDHRGRGDVAGRATPHPLGGGTPPPTYLKMAGDYVAIGAAAWFIHSLLMLLGFAAFVYYTRSWVLHLQTAQAPQRQAWSERSPMRERPQRRSSPRSCSVRVFWPVARGPRSSDGRTPTQARGAPFRDPSSIGLPSPQPFSLPTELRGSWRWALAYPPSAPWGMSLPRGI